MPIFIVVSETLYNTIPLMDDGSGPSEPYCIVELVIAETREQARYLAWKTDRNFGHNCREMPNFRTAKLDRTFSTDTKGIVSDYKFYEKYWYHKKVTKLLASCNTHR